ncbi:type II secretion system F family protein [Vibrio sp. JC009]|uniref:type II secretion system F family protein n=1 Tax=Vibrio sp. JC009 TaxID=2912314 RepID=UPI0023B09E4B|nr:type II secretion system F family protein [Vibrio sp. JC009]WED22301.1 type II secretion system F family protein [Vibrio sp. JC009]
MYWLFLAIGIAFLLFSLKKPKNAKKEYLQAVNQTQFVDNMSDQQAIDMASLSDRNWKQALMEFWNVTRIRLGKAAELKLFLFTTFMALSGNYINEEFLWFSTPLVISAAVLSGWIPLHLWLKKRERIQFEEGFPDALNMLTGAVSSGEGIAQAIAFVGEKLPGDVGQEFRVMGERLQLGETPDEVFRKSCRRFPYPSFQFFVITLRANMSRGGQLKDVLSRLNRLMFLSRAAERKKYALTSEARISSKIVCAMPFIFLFMLQYLNPDNFDFVMFDERGRPILYYVIISEAIGMTIIWALMKGVKT